LDVEVKFFVGPILNGDLDVVVGEDEGSVAGSEFRRHLCRKCGAEKRGIRLFKFGDSI
jgi:hypothetical protein